MKKHYSYLFIIFPIAVFIIIRFLYGFNGLYGQDSYEYLRYCNWLKDSFHSEIGSSSFFWPVAYPLLGAAFSFFTDASDLILQLISLTSFIISLYLVRQILLLIYPEHQRDITIFVLFTLMISPFYLRGALFIMSDSLASMFCLLVIYFLFLFRRKSKAKDLWIAGFITVTAFFTRYPTIILLLFSWIFVVRNIFQPFKLKTILISIAIVAATTLLLLSFKNDNSRGLVTHQWLTEWSVFNSFSSSFITADGIEHDRMINILYAFISFFHPGYFIIGLFLLPFLRKKDFLQIEIKILLASIVIYSFFLMGIPFQNLRFLMISFPLFSILLFPAFERMYAFVIKKKFLCISIFTLFSLIQIALFIYSFRPFYIQNKLEQKIANDIVSNYSPTKEIYTFSIDPALQAYDVKNPICNLWQKTYDVFNKGSLVLFNPDAFGEKWKGKNPMVNWDKMNRDNLLVELKAYQKGWRLYEIR